MGIKSAAKKVGKAIIFMKLFEEIKANKEPLEADIAKLKEIIEEWMSDEGIVYKDGVFSCNGPGVIVYHKDSGLTQK